MWNALGLALTFLTIWPFPRGLQANAAQLAAAMVWFPLVGALLGAVLWLAAAGLMHLVTPLIAAALTLTLLVVATRGLHLDGLADTIDGLGGGHTPERSLAIMKDSAVGAFGVLGLVSVLLIKFALLAHVLGTGSLPALVVFPVAGRWAMVALAYVSPYARREGGLGEAMTLGVSARHFLAATLMAVLIAGVAGGAAGLLALVAVGGLTWLASRWFRRRLGGITGDVLGATNEVGEAVALLLLVVLKTFPAADIV